MFLQRWLDGAFEWCSQCIDELVQRTEGHGFGDWLQCPETPLAALFCGLSARFGEHRDNGSAVCGQTLALDESAPL